MTAIILSVFSLWIYLNLIAYAFGIEHNGILYLNILIVFVTAVSAKALSMRAKPLKTEIVFKLCIWQTYLFLAIVSVLLISRASGTQLVADYLLFLLVECLVLTMAIGFFAEKTKPEVSAKDP